MRKNDLDRTAFRLMAVLSLVAAATAFIGCGSGDDDEHGFSDDPCSPDYYGYPDGAGIIGPGGGQVAVADTSSVICGVKLTAAPGAFDECWGVSISYAGIFSTENYPSGFVPFERPNPCGSVEFEVFYFDPETGYREPASANLSLSFPVGRLACGPTELFAAYYFDETADSWRVVMPDQQTATELVVHTSQYKPQWSWGRIDLAEVDFERYMIPALQARMGAPGWERMQATTDSLYALATAGNPHLTCAALAFARSMCVSFRDDSGARLAVLQAAMGCGTCDIRTQQFFNGIRQYVALNLQSMMWDMFADAMPGRLWFLKLAAAGYSLALEAMARSLPCDYECFVAHAMNPAFLMNLAAYAASYAVIEGIDLFKASGYINCP